MNFGLWGQAERMWKGEFMKGIGLDQEVLGKILVQKFLGALDLVIFFQTLK